MEIAKYITTDQASQIIRVSPGYVRRLLREGRLRFATINGAKTRLIVRESAEKFRDERDEKQKTLQNA